MTTETEQDLTVDKINQLRELFADAPEVGKRPWRTSSAS